MKIFDIFDDSPIELHLEAPEPEETQRICRDLKISNEKTKPKQLMRPSVLSWREVRAKVEPKLVDSARKARDKYLENKSEVKENGK